jgi:hypothetical protein
LALITGAEPAAMQGILSFLLAATAPAFFLLMLHLYPGARALIVAVLATVPWVLQPFFGWQLQRTMMSEGPTVLLALLFCLLALRFGGRLGEWGWRQGAALGVVGGALSLVRGQSCFGALLVVLLLVALSYGAWRRRLPLFVGLACGLLIVVGPIYLKTSVHLRMPYGGTSYTALYNTLEYTPVGRQLGGTRLPAEEPLSEREATRRLQQWVGQGIEAVFDNPATILREGFLHFSRTIYASVGTLFDFHLPPPKKRQPVAGRLLTLYALAGVGLFFAWRRAGPVALAPLVFAVGYFAPTVPFAFYSNRLSMPLSWVGWICVAGAAVVILQLGGRGAGAYRRGKAPARGGR